MPYKKEDILPLLERLNLTIYENNEPIRTGVDFLTGQTLQPPVFNSDEDATTLGLFIQLLQVPEHWNDNDRLVLQLIAAPNTWKVCKHAFLTRIVPMMDMPGTSSSIVLRFSYFTSFLQQRGCTPEEIGSQLISYSSDGNNFDLAPLKFTPLRKFLQDLIKSAERHVIDAYLVTWKQKNWNSLFYRLLSKAHPEREMDYLENILLQTGNLPDQHELSKVLLQNNLQKYESLIEKATDRASLLPDYAAALQGYHLLANHLPEKYHQRLVKTAYDYLDLPKTGMDDRALTGSLVTGQWIPDIIPSGLLAVRALLQNDRQNLLHSLDSYLSEKRYLHPDTFQLLADELGEGAVSLLMNALENDYDAKVVLPALTRLPNSLYIDQLWPFTLHKLKSVRTLVAVVLAEHPLALEKAAELLLSSKADQRLTGVQILCRLNNPHALTLLQQILQKEVNDDARDLMLETLGHHTITGEDDMAVVRELVAYAKKRSKLSKPAEKWLDDSALPPLYLLNGDMLSTDMVRFLMYRMGRVTEIRADVEAKPLLRLIDRSSSGAFAAHLFQVYMNQGGDAKFKYLMTLAALVGDDVLATNLRSAIQYWIDTKRLKMAEHGVAALALQGSAPALREVEFLSRRYRIRKSNVGAAALAALQNTATEMGLSIHELGDRIIPDFGFNGRFKYFEVKQDVYRAFLDSNFKPAYLNDNNRHLKAIPAATSSEVRESFKALTKEVAEIVKLQSLRMEHFLVIQRKWSTAQWQQLFLQHPVMFVFATRIAWGLFDEQEQLITTFYCREDGTLLTLVDTAITLPENASIRILHPVYLDAPTLQQWKQKFSTLQIIPVFPQLERPVAALPPQQAYTTLVHDFEDISMESDILNRYMEQKGWKLSEGSDGKYVYAYHKTDDEHQLEVIVEMSSIYKEDSFRYKLGKLYFIDKTKTQQRWFRSTDKEAVDCLLPLKNVPPVFYSEAITDISISREQIALA
ncbi:DUF4132 domain-containing protein [Chitinophaga sp. RAB17]|uniref:DUF4132 domain-containing protein n=1 Tax=Chitinophaga sp. RAB17 TaxID=3233049 RepID=UPI003F924822